MTPVLVVEIVKKMKKDKIIKVLRWLNDHPLGWASAKELRQEQDFRQNNINEAIAGDLIRAVPLHGITGYEVSDFGKAYIRVN